MLAADGSLDRAALGRVVFAADGDPRRRLALEAITHPLVAERTEQLVAAAEEAAAGGPRSSSTTSRCSWSCAGATATTSWSWSRPTRRCGCAGSWRAGG